jgi:hypothetical protein
MRYRRLFCRCMSMLGSYGVAGADGGATWHAEPMPEEGVTAHQLIR